uniref:Uncharacterized protein LOC109506180 n=1 Tax=Elaeis guineensis var. tenera TaxID=51953 RepID=A0A6J0PLQ0_ELAGV|nr:uncharacterized protein LOC109506180 [Elaeis guineensis]
MSVRQDVRYWMPEIKVSQAQVPGSSGCKDAFINDWNITDNILFVQKFMHDLQCAPIRRSLMMIKLDMERAYGRMSWQFLKRILQEFEFQKRWIDWTMDSAETPSFATLINSAPLEFFHSIIGLRQVQGSVLEPSWLVFGPQPLSHLFIDDCLLIGWFSMWNAKCFASIIEVYYRMSGQLVNLQKSVIILKPKMKIQIKQTIRE